MGPIMIDTPDDIDWLRQVHLPEMPKNVKSAMVFGNEDYPEKIVTFEERAPSIHSTGTVYYPDADGVYFAVKRKNPYKYPRDITIQFTTKGEDSGYWVYFDGKPHRGPWIERSGAEEFVDKVLRERDFHMQEAIDREIDLREQRAGKKNPRRSKKRTKKKVTKRKKNPISVTKLVNDAMK